MSGEREGSVGSKSGVDARSLGLATSLATCHSVTRRKRMPACPMCNKPLRELVRKCPSCQSDLDLLVDYASFLSGGLQRAENLARAGDLGQAVWAYLEVLDVDPDNPAARRQIGQIVRAVRQFDERSPTQ